MLKLLEAIPTRQEWEGLSEDERELWFFTMQYLSREAQLPKVDVEYHPAEMMAILASKRAYALDLMIEFDLGIDYNE